MTLNFCTLFDSFYLSRGLAMINSLQDNCKDFHLFVVAFDKTSETILKELQLANVTVVSQEDFESDELLNIKSSRTRGEYCWTCTPAVIEYCIIQFDLPSCTYIDADLYFFQDPAVLIEEMGDDSVMITDHRYTPKYNMSATTGIYCVQFITFRNDQNGRRVLTWWKDKCIEWCYDRFEDGKFGDQKYLDHWPRDFEGVHVLAHEGGGVAPWNIQQYSVSGTTAGLKVTNNQTAKQWDLVFYHFHAVRFHKNNVIDFGSFKLPETAALIYNVYVNKIIEANTTLATKEFSPRIQTYKSRRYMPVFVHKLARHLLGVYNVHKLEPVL